MVIDWSHLWSNTALVIHLISMVLFLFLAYQFLKSNRREARAVGILLAADGLKSIIHVIYYIIQDGAITPTWVFAIRHVPVLVALIYVFYVLIENPTIPKER